MRWRWGAVALVLVLVGLGAFLIADRHDQTGSPRDSHAAESSAGYVDALAPLQRKLARHFPVQALAASDLPRRPPLVSKRGLPPYIRPTQGMVVTLPGGSRGFVYRYDSNRLAMQGAMAFLGRNDPSAGVFGCGRIVFFTRAITRSAEKWHPRVSALLKETRSGCGPEFIVME